MNAVKRLLGCIMLFLMIGVCKAQYSQLTNIPTIYIETYDNQPVESKTSYIYSTLTYVDGNTMVQYDSLQIRGRGNSTWKLPKKPYRIKFKESTKFLGKGYAKNKNWTLLANHGDKSLLRNAVTFTMGDFLGQPFSPASHFVDLVLNGTYLGNYQVSDQINVDNKRVEVYEQEEIATDTSNITGGYLVEIDGFGSGERVHFRTGKNLIVSVKSPDEDVINTAQKNYIRQYLNDFESALFGNDFKDPQKGYRTIVDSATLVSWYIATELSANVDGFWSTFLYKDRDDPKLYFGPLWDYDIAYNNCSRVGDVTNRDMIEAGFGDDLTKVWVRRMVEDPWFNRVVNDTWKQKVNGGLKQHLYDYIDSMAIYLDHSQQKNYGRYSISSKTYNEIYLYSTYADYIEQLKRFISEHMDFLTARFSERVKDSSDGDNNEGDDDNPVVVLEPFELNDGYYYRIYNKGANKVLDLSESGDSVVIRSPEYGRDTQLWIISQVGERFHLINKATGLAFNDPSPTSAVGNVLNAVEPNTDDTRQLWYFVTVNENGNYNIINVYSDHAINNSGGKTADGNPVLSYTNDDRNAVSNNRQWRIIPEELIPDYIPEEVKVMLMATISDAELFLNGISDEQVGEELFCYSEDQIARLRQMVADAKMLESTVQDDYILAHVNLAEQLAVAQRQQLPSSDKRYVIRHKSSDLYLTITDKQLSLGVPDDSNKGQHYSFEATENGNGVYLKADNGLYVALGTTNSSTMVGQEVITDESRATYHVSIEDDCYRIYTLNGLLGTNATTEGSKVYANKRESVAEEVMQSEWFIEEYIDELGTAQAALEALIAQAKVAITSINKRWIGNAPMQHSRDRIDALSEAIAEAEEYSYASAEEYSAMINWLTELMEALHVLNVPDEDAEYYMRHMTGYNLSCGDGLVMAEADTMDVSQRFKLKPVPGMMNTFHIYTNGMYVTVTEDENTSLALTDTPRDAQGQFLAAQVAANTFSLKSARGYLGTKDLSAGVGSACVGVAEDKGNNIRWRLVKATNEIVDNAIEPMDYMPSIDYAVIYDRDAMTLRFISEDMNVLSGVVAQVYTVGGRLLYTFKADRVQSVADLPSGTYIVRWMLGDAAYDVKFKK